uniref:Uncharacterized protein n=1 Tax=Acidobacterium capsulatum TaxID=33075 RepID=A0A7V4XRV5_9BACT
MEADWSVEMGEGLPEIVIPWSGESLQWVDLRVPHADCKAAVSDLALAEARAPLAQALRALNAENSPWLTSKCDAWWIDDEDEALDPYELDAADLAAKGSSLHGCASYLDLLTRHAELFSDFPGQEALLRTLTQTLRNVALAHARIDLVLRGARLHGQEGFGITAYVTGGGPDTAAAVQAWQGALAAMTRALLNC